MNDGIGLMSRRLARKIAAHLGLDTVPSGFQGRLGGAKGFWIIDSSHFDDDDDEWIEIYRSQTKWVCRYDEDPDHRTFEVRGAPSPLKPADVNEQFLVILEDRAPDRYRLRDVVKAHFERTAATELRAIARAARHPMTLLSLVHQTEISCAEKAADGYVPFLGGLPRQDGEMLKFLLNGGFDMSNVFVADLVKKMAKQIADSLRNNLKISVPRSTYAFMVVDFAGVLDEGEVHLGFSTQFVTDGEATGELHDQDVLVARAPAHFPSDIQKVRAVFRPELRHLKDVIVFSIKGAAPLAEYLSGGDYDGDRAWVCWDPDIVDNFEGVPVPEKKKMYEDELLKDCYIQQDTTTVDEALSRNSGGAGRGTSEFMTHGFLHATRPNMLGRCTAYKEKVCYHDNSISSDRAIALSALLGRLVDQEKQGVIFTPEDLGRVKTRFVRMPRIAADMPAYKSGSRPDRCKHILDWLRFEVAEPVIEREMRGIMASLSKTQKMARTGEDKDLEFYSDELDTLANSLDVYEKLRRALHRDLKGALQFWKDTVPGPLVNDNFPSKLEAAYQKWLSIRPPEECLADRALRVQLFGAAAAATGVETPDSHSYWGKLKASVTFKLFQYSSVRFVFRVAGRQLQAIKAERCTARDSGDGGPVPMIPGMYALHRPHNKLINSLMAPGKDEQYENVVESLQGLSFADET